MNPTLAEISDLIEAALKLARTARRRTLRSTSRQCVHIANQLDATRTVLVQEGPDYLEAAQSMVISAADLLAAHAVYVGRHTDREPKRPEKAPQGLTAPVVAFADQVNSAGLYAAEGVESYGS